MVILDSMEALKQPCASYAVTTMQYIPNASGALTPVLVKVSIVSTPLS